MFKTAEPCRALIERASGRIGNRVTGLRLGRGHRVGAAKTDKGHLGETIRIRAAPAAPGARLPTSGNGAPPTPAVDRGRRGSWEPDALEIRGYLCRSISAAISAVS